MKKTIIPMLAIMIVMAMQATAIGVTPAIIKTDYTPGIEQIFQATIVNTEDRTANIVIFPEGELTLIPTEDSLTLKPYESKTITSTYLAPQNLESGTKEGKLVIQAAPEPGKGIIATTAVVTALQVDVPYEGKEIKADIGTRSVDNKLEFVIAVTNLGTEEISDLRADISVWGDSIHTESVTLEPGKRKELKSEWTAPTAGKYEAQITINYDGKTKQVTKEFSAENNEVTYYKVNPEQDSSRLPRNLLIAGLAILILMNAYIYVRRQHKSDSIN